MWATVTGVVILFAGIVACAKGCLIRKDSAEDVLERVYGIDLGGAPKGHVATVPTFTPAIPVDDLYL